MMQGTLCFKEYKNGDEELYNYSDLHISCKYGFCEWGQTPVQVGTITDASLQTSATYGFITISGDSQNIVANWDETQHVDQDPVIYDVVITVDNMKINKFSNNDPDTTGWYSIGDCQTIDGYEENPIYFSPGTTNVYDLETQEETKAWSTTEPYFGTGVIANGAYFSSLNNYYIIIDGTNHPGELSFSQSDSWDSDNVQNYSKQTSGSMFYMWRSTDITECTALNHYTWDSSNVKLCYDNTTELTVNGITYTKQNPGPSYYELKCGFNYGGSVRPAKTFIRWGTNEPYTQVIYGGVNPEYFSWQEQSVPSGEIGTLVVEFTDANNNGLTVDSYSSQDYVFDTDTAGSYGGTRLLIKSPDNSNIYEYSAGNFIECNITLENAQPSTPYSVTIVTEGQGTVDGIHSGDQTGQYYLTAIPDQGWVFDHWTISGWTTQDNPLDTSFPDAHQTVYVYFVQEGPGPQPTEKHIYLCDNSGAHLAEMTKTGSTWSVSGAFTSGMYSIRATVENEYEDAWFKFYQTSGDNRIFVGAGDDPSFEDIGTYIMIDDILTSFSLTEDQETGYYVVSYENTGAMTVSMVDTIVNSYIGELNIPTDTSDLTNGAGFITVSDVSSMSYITMTDIEACGYIDQATLSSMSYITMTDVQSLGYIDQTSLSNMSYVDSTSLSAMSYVDQTSLSSMSYVDNTYLSTYMNAVVGDINSILQTI